MCISRVSGLKRLQPYLLFLCDKDVFLDWFLYIYKKQDKECTGTQWNCTHISSIYLLGPSQDEHTIHSHTHT